MEPPTRIEGPRNSRNSVLSVQHQETTAAQQVETTYPSPCTIWEKIYSYLIRKGVMTYEGSPTGPCINFSLFPLSKDEFLRLKNLFHQKFTLRTASMEHSIEFDYTSLILEVQIEFAKVYPKRKFGQIYLSGSAVFKVLGMSYFLAMLEKLQIHDMPLEFYTSIQSEFSKPLNDVDIRIWIPGITLEELETLRIIVIKVFDQKFYKKYGEIFSDKNLRPEIRHHTNLASDSRMSRGYFVKNSIVNLLYPQNIFLITGFGDRIQNESELLWIGSLSRFSLAVNDAINIPIDVAILAEDNQLFRNITPICHYQYPTKVFFDRILLVKTLDQVETIDRSGWGRVILDLIRGYTNISQKEQEILLISMLEEAYNYGAGPSKISKIIEVLREILSSHGGRSPQFRILFILQALSCLVNHVGIKSNRFKGKVILEVKEVEEIRRGLLKGLSSTHPNISSLLMYILLILESKEIPVELACDYINACLYISFLRNEEGKDFKFFHDLKRSPNDVQLKIESSEKAFWYRFPFEISKALIGLKKLQNFQHLSIVHFLHAYLAGLHNSTFRTLTDLHPSTFSALCETSEFLLKLTSPTMKSLGLRIALVIMQRHSYPELRQLIHLNIPVIFIFDRTNGINSQISVYKDLKGENEEAVALEIVKRLIKAREITHYSSVLALLERYPVILQELEKLCVEQCDGNPILIFRIWKRYHKAFSKKSFEKIFPKLITALESSKVLMHQIDLNFIFHEAATYLENNPECYEFDSALLTLIRNNLTPISYFPVLNLMTTGKRFKANSKVVLDIWFNLNNDITPQPNRGVIALAHFCMRNSHAVIIPILIELTKFLKKSSPTANQLFEDNCKILYVNLLTILCTESTDPTVSKESSEWMMLHFFELGEYRIVLDKPLFSSFAKKVNVILNKFADKISEKGWSCIRPHLKATFKRMESEKLFEHSIPMAGCLIAANPILWKHIIEASKECGGFRNIAQRYYNSLYALLDNSLNLDPIPEEIACEEIARAISEHIVSLIVNKDIPSTRRWKVNLEELLLIPSLSANIGACFLHILKAHVEKGGWIEAAEILTSKVKYFYRTSLPFQLFLHQTLEGLKGMNVASAIQAQLELRFCYKVFDDVAWDTLYRKIPDLKNKIISERAWDIFWQVYEPFKNSKIRCSLLISATEALVKCQSAKILEVANEDIDHKIRFLVGSDPDQKYFRIFATQFLTGALGILSKSGEIRKYATSILRWRKPLSISLIHNTNFRSIDIPLISTLSLSGDPSLLLEAIEVTKLLFKGDPLSVDNKHDDVHITERCRTLCDLIRGIVKFGDNLPALEEYGNYIYKVGRLKEFHRLLLEAFIENKNGKYTSYIYRFIYFQLSDLSYLKSDESSNFMKGILKILTAMVQTGNYEYLIFCEVIFSFLKFNSEPPLPWKKLFKIWIDALVSKMENEEKVIPEYMTMLLKHPLLLQSIADKPFFMKILNLIFTLENKAVDIEIEKITKALFDSHENKSIKEVQSHSLQKIRHLFLTSLVTKNIQDRCWLFYPNCVEIVARHIEVLSDAPEEVFCISSLFTMVAEYIQRYISVQTYEFNVKNLFSLILALKDGKSRYNVDNHRILIYKDIKPEFGCYLCNIPQFKPQRLEMKRVNNTAVVRIPESKSPNDFLHPDAYFCFFSLPSQNSYFPQLMALFIESLLDLKPANPIHKAYVMDMIYINLLEMIKFVRVSKIPKISVNIYRLVYKFITTIPESIDVIHQHEFKCSILLEELNKINSECDLEELALCHVTILECKKRLFKLPPEKFRRVVITTIKDHCRVFPKELMIPRINKALKIFKDYLAEFIGSNDLETAYNVFLESFPHIVPESYSVLPSVLESFELVLFHEGNENLKSGFMTCLERLIKLNSAQPHIALLKFMIKLLVRAKESKYFENCWNRYFEFIEALSPFIIYHIEDEKEFYKSFLPLFDFSQFQSSKHFKSLGNKINAILKNLIDANKKALALTIFTEAVRLKIYERYPQHLENAKSLLCLEK